MARGSGSHCALTCKIVLPFALTLAACGTDEGASGPTPTASPSPTSSPTQNPAISVTQFGFAAIACDHDDPFDTDPKTDFSDEVAGFSNFNQVCPTGDLAIDRDRLVATAQFYDPLYYIEPVFFDPATGSARPQTEANNLWQGVRQAIADSQIDTARITFYLFDEPTLRGIAHGDLAPFANQIKQTYPDSKILLIEAFSDTTPPVVPDFVDLWGFNAYTIRDPAAEPRYTSYLDQAAAQLRSDQALVLVGDGIHTPFHANAGLSQADMAEVARNYFALAESRNDVAALLVYTWAGGIDNNQERGVRDLPVEVQDQWRAIGTEILTR